MNIQGENPFERGKIPPQAIDLEEAVLGAVMLEKGALIRVADLLFPEVFYKDQNRVIYEAIQKLFNRSEAVDILTVTEELRKEGNLEIAGGAYYVTILTNRVSSTANIEFHAHIILQKYILRELIRMSGQVIQESFEDTEDVFDIIAKLERELFSITAKNMRKQARHVSAQNLENIQTVERIRQEGGIIGIPSGLEILDAITLGWQKEDLIILAARPGMGKTALAVSIAYNIAKDFNIPVGIFSLEMAEEQLVFRLQSISTGFNYNKIKGGMMNDYEFAQFIERTKEISNLPIYIDDQAKMSIFELRAKATMMKHLHKIEIFFVDYIQLIEGNRTKGMTREQEISSISRELKAIAKDLDVPIIALSQLSRAVESRGGKKRPQLQDLRESGAIEQDADLVIFIYRPEYYGIESDDEGNPTHGVAEIIVEKHRNGKTGITTASFDANTMRFMNTGESREMKLDNTFKLFPEEEDNSDSPF